LADRTLCSIEIVIPEPSWEDFLSFVQAAICVFNICRRNLHPNFS